MTTYSVIKPSHPPSRSISHSPFTLFAFVLIFLSVSAHSAIYIGYPVQATQNLNVRTSPSTSAAVVATALAGSRGTAIEGPQVGSGLTWYKVNWAAGYSGWSASAYLDEVPTPVPTPIGAPQLVMPGNATAPGPALSGSTVDLYFTVCVGCNYQIVLRDRSASGPGVYETLLVSGSPYLGKSVIPGHAYEWYVDLYIQGILRARSVTYYFSVQGPPVPPPVATATPRPPTPVPTPTRAVASIATKTATPTRTRTRTSTSTPVSGTSIRTSTPTRTPTSGGPWILATTFTPVIPNGSAAQAYSRMLALVGPQLYKGQLVTYEAGIHTAGLDIFTVNGIGQRDLIYSVINADLIQIDVGPQSPRYRITGCGVKRSIEIIGTVSAVGAAVSTFKKLRASVLLAQKALSSRKVGEALYHIFLDADGAKAVKGLIPALQEGLELLLQNDPDLVEAMHMHQAIETAEFGSVVDVIMDKLDCTDKPSFVQISSLSAESEVQFPLAARLDAKAEVADGDWWKGKPIVGPNPWKGGGPLRIVKAKPGEMVTVYNLAGERVLRFGPVGSDGRAEATDVRLATGVYLVQVAGSKTAKLAVTR